MPKDPTTGSRPEASPAPLSSTGGVAPIHGHGLILGLAVALAAACSCSREPSVDPGLAALVPPDATFIAGARLDRLRKSPLYPRLVAAAPDALRRLEAQTVELLAAYDGREALFLARGEFSKAPVDGVALLGPGIVGYSARGVPRAPAKATPPGLLRSAPEGASAWLVASALPGFGEETPSGRAHRANLERLMAQVRLLTVAVQFEPDRFRQGIEVRAVALSPDESSAEAVDANLRGLLGLARMLAPRADMELAAALDAIGVKREGVTVSAQARWPGALVEKLLGRWMEEPPMSPGGR